MQQSLVMHVVLIFFNDTATTEIYTLSLLDALPIFMRYLESVKVTGEGRSHWVAKAPGGSVEWDAEVTEDRPNQLISWRSLEGSEAETSGTVRFEPAGGGRGAGNHDRPAYHPSGGGGRRPFR